MSFKVRLKLNHPFTMVCWYCLTSNCLKCHLNDVKLQMVEVVDHDG